MTADTELGHDMAVLHHELILEWQHHGPDSLYERLGEMHPDTLRCLIMAQIGADAAGV